MLAAEFRDQEDTQGYLRLVRTIAQSKGLPVAVYSDRHGIFHRHKQTPLTLAEQLRGGPDPTQVQRALQELGIRWIPASSPQAKGRIERLFATFQDRLRVELRLAGVHNRADANTFLAQFLPRYNARFTQPAVDPTPAYRPWEKDRDPDTVFCFKYRRAVANDNTVTLGPHRLQLLPGPGGRSFARLSVEVHERLNGTLAVFHQNQRLRVRRLTVPAGDAILARNHRRARLPSPLPISYVVASHKAPMPRSSDRQPSTRQPWKPAPDHPWRHSRF